MYCNYCIIKNITLYLVCYACLLHAETTVVCSCLIWLSVCLFVCLFVFSLECHVDSMCGDLKKRENNNK